MSLIVTCGATLPGHLYLGHVLAIPLARGILGYPLQKVEEEVT